MAGGRRDGRSAEPWNRPCLSPDASRLAIAAGWLRLNVYLSTLMLVIGKFARYGVLIFGTLQIIA